MNKKIIKYCSDTLKKIIEYHHCDNETLLAINKDLKILQSINPVNLYKISLFDRKNDKNIFENIENLLSEKYIQTDIVRNWLTLFITNPTIKFEEIISAADNFNSNFLELEIRLNDEIELSELREKQIINFVFSQLKNDKQNNNQYEYYIINITKNHNLDDVIKTEIFHKQYINNIKENIDSNLNISKSDLLNIMFDYFIINKQRESYGNN